MPQFRFRGQNASLLCKYELEPNEELFSLKWYKEDTEFYRYTLPRSKTARLVSHQRERERDWRKGGGLVRDGTHHQQQQHQASRHMPEPEGHVQSWKVPGIKIDVRKNCWMSTPRLLRHFSLNFVTKETFHTIDRSGFKLKSFVLQQTNSKSLKYAV